jgi:DNA-binding transcriptional LysR family regulator
MQHVDFRLLVALDALLQESTVTGAARRVGLSTPAMSHALTRIRGRLGDPILVRAGRSMLLTPRAESLKASVHSIVADARRALSPVRPFAPEDLDATFTIHASDYVLTILGFEVDRILRERAPQVALRYIPNTTDDPKSVREGASDMAVGIYGDLPPEMRSRRLLTDRFVCVLRRNHPALGRRFGLEDFLALLHIQVAPRGQPGGYIDDVLREKGHARRVARAVPYFLTGLELAAATDYVLTISERIAKRYAASMRLEIVDAPLPLRPYALNLVWHPRVDAEGGHKFLRESFVRAAKEAAGDTHAEPRTRLGEQKSKRKRATAKRV